MKLSYNWLQSYFKEKLPTPEKIEEAFIFHSFEVEGLEKTDNDTVFDVKILPDRAHDCLGHIGPAYDLAAIFNLPIEHSSSLVPAGEIQLKTSKNLSVKIANEEFCRRYIGRRVENFTVKESPKWLADSLIKMGQKPIMNIVDATNFVLFDLGQPMHAFDADKIVGGITVRLAKDGEKITTLDNKEIALDPTILIIADDEGPLAIAGIKGGKKAEVDANTKNLILESASFDPVSVRKSTIKINVRTDASKRYENDLSSEVAGDAMDELSSLLASIDPGCEFGTKVDVYPKKQVDAEIVFSTENIQAILGIKITAEEIADILKRDNFQFQQEGDNFAVRPCASRLDLKIKEDMAEEIGRLYGYDKIPGKLLETPVTRGEDSVAVKNFKEINKIRESLVRSGFSEIYGYALTSQGEFELENPLASDKAFLRSNLTDFIKDRLAFNLQNVLFDNEPVKIFEIGRVFPKEGEMVNLSIGVAYKKQKKIKEDQVREDLSRVCEQILHDLNIKDFPWEIDFTEQTFYGQECLMGIVEVSLEMLTAKAGDFAEPSIADLLAPEGKTYKRIPAYPRIIRDVALFVPEGTDEKEVVEVIKNAAGELLFEGPIKFDEFHKDGKVSYAFRSVFQSYERTLSDDEINSIWQKVSNALSSKGWEIR